MFGVPARGGSAPARRGRVPGDVPARAARLRVARARRAPARVGVHDRRARRRPTSTGASGATGVAEIPDLESVDEAAGRLRGARAADRRRCRRRSARRSCSATATTSTTQQIGAALGSSAEAARQAASSGVRRLRRKERRHERLRPISTAASARRALAAGLLDVAYDIADTPIGTLLVAATDRGLCRHLVRPRAASARRGPLARAFGARVLRVAARGRRGAARSWTSTSRAGAHDFDLADRPPASRAASAARVLDELARVPYGEVTTYGALAAQAGRPARRAGRRARS